MVLPLINGEYYFPQDAALFSIILNKSEQSLPWIHNNYIQIMAKKDLYHNVYAADFNKLDIWNNCPWIIRHNIPYSVIQTGWESISEFLKSSLNKGLYCFMNYDRFYVEKYFNGTKGMIHEALIYGYENNEFIMRDFIYGANYTELRCEDYVINKASLMHSDAYDYLSGVDLLEFRDYEYFVFDCKSYKKQLEEYVQGICTLSRFDIYPGFYGEKEKHFFGINVYQSMKTYCVDIDKNNEKLDLRIFYLEKYHKKLLYEALAYLTETNLLRNGNSILSKFLPLCKKVERLLNLCIKYNFSERSFPIEKIINLIVEISFDEQEWLLEIIDSLVIS